MALNKFMHPRNIYKTPPDFAKLSKNSKEFSEIAKVDVTGKVSIDFKNPNALRVLTKCLLKSDFNVDIIIPEDRLVPTLPLRLNYLLWIEDLLNAIKETENVIGLDIGTGACAIYPVLAAVRNQWHMIGTETDEDSLHKATENINRNNLQNLITGNPTTNISLFMVELSLESTSPISCLKQFHYLPVDRCGLWSYKVSLTRGNHQPPVEEPNCTIMTLDEGCLVRKNVYSSVFKCVLQDDPTRKFHFSMCNPPFYSNFQDLWESRSPARPPPKNGFTGSPQELITEGGELQFCRKIIEESKIYKDNILIFTTMVGHKYNLKELLLDVQAEGLKHTTTEFCQGRVTRWGLAWTYQDYDLRKLVPPRDKSRKRNVPTIFTLPRFSEKNDMELILQNVKLILKNLEMSHKIINSKKNEVTLDIVALTNTWCNQRRKRRLMKKSLEDKAKKVKLDNEVEKSLTANFVQVNDNVSNPDFSEVSNNLTNTDCSEVNNITNKEEKESDDVGKSVSEPIIHAVMRILNNDNDISVSMEYLDGGAGKEGLHQIIQYIKNNWK